LICVPLGCLFSGSFTEHASMGRRKAMQLVNVPIMVAWLLFYFSTNVNYLYAGLCLTGLTGGLLEAPVCCRSSKPVVL
jgi:MFS family permease